LIFDISTVPPIQISTEKGYTMSFFEQISLKNNFKASLNTNMWQVYTRPTSASDFFITARNNRLVNILFNKHEFIVSNPYYFKSSHLGIEHKFFGFKLNTIFLGLN
jgi:hypothetical protein